MIRPTALAACLALAAAAPAADDYKLTPDSLPQAGVPKGKLEGPFTFESKVFPGTTRQFWVYVPAKYDPKTPAAVMVFQDGHAYALPNEGYKAPVVFDNLIHKGEMPVTVGIFVNPGAKANEPAVDARNWGKATRSFEYDSLTGQYATFLADELLPEVAKTYNLTTDPDRRAICGASSGGICAFTAAWERPDLFRKVVTHIGSFTNIKGGHVYPQKVRDAANKPIRVALQDGSGDNRNPKNLQRDWYLQNRLMADALRDKGYDLHVAFGDGGHGHKHGAAILPDQLRWLWRDHKGAR